MTDLKNIKKQIDEELSTIYINKTLRKRINESLQEGKKQHKLWKTAAASLVILLLSGTTVAAGYHWISKISVNREVMPALDDMKVVSIHFPEHTPDENGMTEMDFKDYDSIQSELGIHLLDTTFSSNQYALVHLSTDHKDFAVITVDNYITGDTSGYRYLPEEKRYEYESGEKYHSPVSLTADIVLSREQLKNGWETDYLGLYQSLENYQSRQGYRVNMLQDTTGEKDGDRSVLSEKCAIFVADGIRYTLKGRVSSETMKEIIDSME